MSDAISLLRRHVRLIAITILIGTILAAVAAYKLPDVFTATSTLVLERNDRRLLEADPSLDRPDLSRAAIETEINIFRSRGFAGQIVDEFNLIEDPSLNPYAAAANGQPPSDSGFYLPDGIRDWLSSVGIHTKRQTGAQIPDLAVQRERTVAALLSRLTVTRSGESLAISIKASHPQADKAADLANAVTGHYVKRSYELKREGNVAATIILRERAEQLASDIARTEGEISELRRIYQLQEAEDKRGNQLRAEAGQLKVRLELLKEQQAEITAEFNELERLAQNSEQGLSGMEISSAFPALVPYQAEEAELMKDRVRLALLGDQQHPELVRSNARLSNLREKIQNEVQRLQVSSTRKKQQIDDSVREMEADLEKLENRLRERSKAEITLSKLERELLTDRNRHNQILEGLGVLDLQAEVLNPGARVVSPAQIPVEAAYPKRKTIVAGGFVGSAMLAIVLVLLAEGLNKKLRTDQQTRQITRLPNLGYVPEILAKWWGNPPKPHKCVNDIQHTFYAEAIRSLYIACRRSDFENPPKVVMLTSSLPNEGKTSLAMSLAATAASNGQRTALVDLDLHRCGVAHALDLDDEDASLDEYILSNEPVADYINRDNSLPGVDIFAITRPAKQRSTLLSSDRIRELFVILRKNYDLVVVDTPPTLIINDASWTASLVDAAILVVRWGSTTADALGDAVKRLRMNHVRVLGTVISRVDPRVQARLGYGGSLAYYKYAKNYYSG